MTEASPDVVSSTSEWRRAKFFLIVTGEAERDSLKELFRRFCHWSFHLATFTVTRRNGQHRPRAVTKGDSVPPKELGTKLDSPKAIEQAWLDARKHLRDEDSFVLLVDDLEWERKDEIERVFATYSPRPVLFGDSTSAGRVGVFFLRMMREAYYWADLSAVESLLGQPRSSPNVPDDVEEIRNPKGLIEGKWPNFKDREHAGPILKALDVDWVLADPTTCASLRTLYAWCSRAMGFRDAERFQLRDGRRCPVTSPQIDRLPPPWRDGQPKAPVDSG